MGLRKDTIRIALVAMMFAVGFVVTASGQMAVQSTDKNIVQTADSAGSFITLVEAIKNAKLEEILQTEGPFTVFAPTDEAFDKLPAGTLEDLLKPENRDKLANILTKHVVAGNFSSKALAGMKKIDTVEGTSILLSHKNGQFYADDAKIVKTDIPATNGVIHVIDKVITPNDIVQTAQTAGAFNTLLKAAEAAGIVDSLKDPKGNLTLFAPTDDAFNKLPPGTLENLLKPENKQQLADILKYHVVPTQVIIQEKPIESLLGKQLAIRPSGPLQVNQTPVVLADIKATNGIIQVIDRVLIPPSDQPAQPQTAINLIETTIQQGAPLFNAGQPAKCATLYKQASQKLLIQHANSLDEFSQKRLADALTTANTQKDATSQAWTMRYALDDVYSRLNQQYAKK